MESAKSHSLPKHPGVERDRLVCLEQITELRRLSLRTNRPIAFSVSSLQDAIKRYGMKCNTLLYVSCVATPPTTHLVGIFTNYIRSLSRKSLNVRNTASPCSRFYVTSGLGPCPVDPRWRTKMAAF